MPVFKDITGQKFGQLTAIRVTSKSKRGPIWEFLCDCGRTTYRISTLVVTGHTTSCGCVRRKTCSARNRKHGEAVRNRATKEYRTWAVMIRRCRDEDFVQYEDYGGRGITVCQRWLDSFDDFLADVGRAPSPAHTIDRINNNGNYEPGNVKWSTRREQASNTRRNRFLTHAGETLILAEWSRRTGIHHVTILSRLKAGKTVAEALTP